MKHQHLLVLILFWAWLPSRLDAEEIGFPEAPDSSQTSGSSETAALSVVESEHGVVVMVDGKPFAEYIVDDINKPYLWPVIGPTGKSMTRAFPMKEVPYESTSQRDHPHHRGITFGHNRIDTANALGGDTWHEWITFGGRSDGPGESPSQDERIKNIARIVHRSFTEIESNANGAMVTELCDHISPNGKLFLTETRRLTFRAQAKSRSIDVDQVFTASDDQVRFHDRKDAGLSIRVPASMALDSGQNGKIVNSEGEMDGETWSRAAKWCDYHGKVDGEHLGIAFLNHPSSFRFPTRWHVRDYGLFTANPFASRSYDASLPDGTTTLAKGEQLKLHHRIIFHVGDPASAGIEEAWTEYANTHKE